MTEDTIVGNGWKVYAHENDKLLAEYLFAVKDDAEKFEEDMKSKGYETKLLRVEWTI